MRLGCEGDGGGLTKSKLALVGLIPGIFALDWISKRWIERHVSFWDTHAVIPGLLSIVHAQNRGRRLAFWPTRRTWCGAWC